MLTQLDWLSLSPSNLSHSCTSSSFWLCCLSSCSPIFLLSSYTSFALACHPCSFPSPLPIPFFSFSLYSLSTLLLFALPFSCFSPFSHSFSTLLMPFLSLHCSLSSFLFLFLYLFTFNCFFFTGATCVELTVISQIDGRSRWAPTSKDSPSSSSFQEVSELHGLARGRLVS